MNTYDKAFELYKHQHDRWNHWAIFFFGLMATVFVIYNNVKDVLPLWLPSLLAFAISIAWVCVALSIRATSFSWVLIVQRLECLSDEERADFKLLAEFDKELKKRSQWQDLRETMKVWTWEPYRRVTRLITLLGVIMSVGFLAMFFTSLAVDFQSKRIDTVERRSEPKQDGADKTSRGSSDRWALSQTITNTLLGLFTGVIGSFIGFAWWPRLRRGHIWRKLRVFSEPYPGVGSGVWCRVVNESSFTMGKAITYISIDHSLEDLIDAPSGCSAAYMNTTVNRAIVREAQLCWSVQESGVNPMRVDIYAGEEQPLTIAFIHESSIEFVSEKCRNPARAFLTKKSYTGTLKVVCLDCAAKSFKFRFDPASAQPLSFE